MAQTADRNLLLGILALQLDFINREALVAAMFAWSADKDRGLEDVLVAQGALDPADGDALRVMLARQIARHGGAAASLAALSTFGSAREVFGQITDPDIQASLAHAVATRAPDDAMSTSAPVDVDPSPSVRYRRLRPHARGNLGEVFVAHDHELHREVALKEIQDKHADVPSSRTRFLVEAEITGGLEHPGIVPVYGLGHYADGRPFYAMRFIKGDNLATAFRAFHADDTIRHDPGARNLALQKLLRRFLDVCNAIDYAHSRGVLHRDLKPGNIMVGQYGETLVVDWGLAKTVGQAEGDEPGESNLVPHSGSGMADTMAGSAVGTPAYMSPEQARGELDRLGPATDVYSLGATLYELLTGRVSVAGGDLGSILGKVGRGEIAPPRSVSPSVPRPLEAVCLRAMALRPGDRYASARALAEDIEHWLADEPVAALSEGIGAKVSRWTRRHRSATLSAAAALVAITLAATSAFLVVRGALADRTKALADEQTARDAQKKAKETAEQRESMAVEAIKSFEKAVVDNPQLKNDTRLRPLRNAMLKEPLQFSRDLIVRLQADGDTRPESLSRLADACFSLGKTTSEIGDQEDALKAFQESAIIRERLARENPADTAVQSALAATHGNIGVLQRTTGRNDLALAASRRVLEIQERLTRENPADSAFQNGLARIHMQLDLLHRAMGRNDLALAASRRALEIQERLATENPADTAFQNDLAFCHNNIGNLHLATGHADLAIASLRRALEIRERLAKENPTVTALQTDLAHSHNNIGVVQNATGHADLALASFQRALEIQERLARENPAVITYQNALAAGHNNIGQTQSDMGRKDLALAAYRQALEIREQQVRENPTVTEFRTVLAASHYDIACALALHAAATSDSKMAISFADQAMESLRRADTAGWSRWKHTAEDTDLKSLRDRPDFQALLRERTKPKDAAKE
jgi:serine/threonine protein kinase